MTSFHRLTHARELPCGCDDFKDLGTFSSRALAESQRSKAKKLPGFKDHAEGLHIDEVTLDQARWTEGFVTLPTPDGVAVGRPMAEEIKKKIAALDLNRIVAAMTEGDGRQITRREVGDFVSPTEVATMADLLRVIGGALELAGQQVEVSS